MRWSISLRPPSTLLDDHFLAGTLRWQGVKSRHTSWSVWESMGSHIFAVRFSDDAEGPRVGVRYVSDWVSVQSGLVCDRTNLLDRQLRTWLGWVRKGHIKRFFIAECYVGAGAQASGGLLGWCGGILWCRLRDILIQPLKEKILYLHKNTIQYKVSEIFEKSVCLLLFFFCYCCFFKSSFVSQLYSPVIIHTLQHLHFPPLGLSERQVA